MDARPYSIRQSQVLNDGRSAWDARASLLLHEEDLSGGVRWKSVRGRDYLVRYWTEASTGLKRSKSFGPRSQTTEAMFASLVASKSKMREDKVRLDNRLSAWTDRVQQLGMGRLSPFASEFFEEAHKAGIAGMQLVDRDHALPQSVHLGLELLDVPALDPFELGSRASLVLVPDDVRLDAVADVALRCHRDLVHSGHMILGREGTRIVAMLVRKSHLVGWAARHGGRDVSEALLQCLEGDHIGSVVPDARGLPLLVSAVPPAASVLMAFCARNTEHVREPNRLEEYAIDLAGLLLDREDPLMLSALRLVPDLMERVQEGGYNGVRI